MATRYPAATWHRGPYNKVWPVAPKAGVVLHSMEGPVVSALGVLADPNGGSWHFSISKWGRVYQHYELNESPWHAGSRGANQSYIGVEHEGKAGEPLTPAQLKASKALVQWLHADQGWGIPERGKTLFEHNELDDTECPSGRIPWEEYLVNLSPKRSAYWLALELLLGRAHIVEPLPVTHGQARYEVAARRQ